MSDVLAAVLRHDVDLATLPPETPAPVRRLIARCLDRDAKTRLRDIGEARIEIARVEAGAPDPGSPPATSGPAVPMWRRALPWAIAGALAVALAVSLPRGAGPASDGAPLRRFTIEIPWNLAPNWTDFDVAISPDGTQVAYNCREGNTVNLCLRALDSLTARPVAEGRDAQYWFFSPDGQWIGIVDEVGLTKVSVRGGRPQPILSWPTTEAPDDTHFVWTADDHILFGSPSGIQRVASSGGAPEPVTHVADGSDVVGHVSPSLLPDGRSALITIAHRGSATCGLVDLEDGSVRDLGIGNAVTGDLAYYDHVAFEIWIRSPDGQRRMFLGGPGRKRSGRFSPDGKWIAFVSDETGDYQVYVTAYPGPGPTVAVSTQGGLSPLWSADGRELFYRLGSKVMAATMSSPAPLAFSAPVELFDGPYTLDLMGHQREGVTRDGRFLMVENSDDFPIVVVQNWAAELARLVR